MDHRIEHLQYRSAFNIASDG